ncbi:MAG: tRNA 2-thiouridine(34) synthase MnmA [Acidimicrobiales bacterium]|nr:tRNA 2-thiouridine(34) synthase MnmA [Acidimicrobiales bacterium]MCB1260262.1 tRNA 2-thiouridine(34) synthase MnmA [Acidimicrobiales bacterium]
MSRVLVGLSGGVDSSVAAVLLRDAGHDVVGVTMRLWGGEGDQGCCSVSDVDDARRVAQQLDIDFAVFDFSDAFDRQVVEPYVAEHGAGRTPNPCVECNRHLKFDRLLRRAEALGFDAVATGHHARVVGDGPHRRVARGADAAKDQSYVLAMLTQPVLEHLLLPIGELTKEQVRTVATAAGLRTAAKPDSQDVCFITAADGRRRFLEPRLALHPGTLVDTGGTAVGSVDAIELVTVGQRKGLGLEGGDAPRYVIDVDVARRQAVVGRRDDLDAATVGLESVVWSAEPVGGAVLAQTSAHGTASRATVDIEDPGRSGLVVDGGGAALGRWLTPGELAGTGRVRLRWDVPQRRVAPGQTVALYRADRVVGCGIAV